ncbi:tyrosine-protein kinase STYK1-like isoform X2 [Echeneis naucrates]|nr:tyrosine-protein kinase STYK1-like isoform X2 [Echeneis naucrates]
MSSNSTEDDLCAPDDTLCRVREHQQAVIIVPTLLLFGSLVTILALILLRYCPERTRPRVTARQSYNPSSHRHTQRHRHSHSHSRHLQGIDAPPGLNPLEHEELPMSVQQVQQNVKPIPVALHQTSTERHLEAFSQVTALPVSFPIKPNNAVSLYRARMGSRDVVLSVLKETANSSEKQHFLGFASFVSGLGPHPFIPTLMGVISVQPPFTMVVEELQHRDLLGFLWKCRQDNSGLESPYEMTEQRIFTMARQVASALNYLHSQSCIHGNMGARSILVSSNLTAKLWGFGTAYRRTQNNSSGEVEVMELKKWQAPEVLARRGATQSSDVWSFGILLYEMATLGDAPFSELMATELLQHLQRGKHLRRPAACSNSL